MASSTTIPQFATVPESEMPKAKQYATLPQAEIKLRAAYDKFITSLKPNQAGVVPIVEGSSGRSVAARIRGSFKRTALQMGKMRIADNAVYVTLGSKNGTSA